MDQHAGLARAGAGEHEQRALAVLDRLALGRIELGEQLLDRCRADPDRRAVLLLEGGLLVCWNRLGHRPSRIAARPAAARRDAAGPGRRRNPERRPRRPQPPAVLGPRFGRSSWTSPLGGVAVELREALLERAEPLGEAPDRVRDRVGQVDPVVVGPLDLAALDPHGVARVADDGRVRWNVTDHDRVGADFGAVADRDRAEQLRAGADRRVVLDGRVALAALKAGAAEGHALIDRHAAVDLGGLADHHAGAVVDEEVVADLRRRMDLDAGHDARCVGHGAGQERYARVVQGVRDAMGEDGLHPTPGREDLRGARRARRRIAVARGADVVANLAHHAGQGAEAEHA